MSSRRRTVGLTVTSGLLLTMLAPIGPLSFPNALGLDRVGRDMPRAVAAEPVPAVAERPTEVQAASVVQRRSAKPVTTPATRLLPDAAKGPRCDNSQTPSARKARYNGKSVSRLYDKVFRPGPEMPHLDGWVPQGLTVWRDWDGKGNTLVLLGMYRQGAKSFIVGIDPRTGRHIGTVRVKASHLGALGVTGKWLIAQDAMEAGQQPAVRRYTLSKLRGKMKRSAATSTKPFMAAHGKTQKVHGASYMFVEGDSLWIGRYARSINPKMYRYKVSRNGLIEQVEGPWRVPRRTQGVAVTQDHFVFTSSLGGKRGRMIVVRRAAPKRIGNAVACLWTPSLPQNVAVYRGRMLTAFESGATRFNNRTTRNKISHLHVGQIESLIRIADPTSLRPFFAPAAPIEAPEDLLETPEEIGSQLRGAGLSADRMAERAAAAEASASPQPAPPVEPAPGPDTEVDPVERSVPSEHQPADPEFGIEAGPGTPSDPQAPAESDQGALPTRISDARESEQAQRAARP